MNAKTRCSDLAPAFPALRAGEVSPLQRTRLEAHLAYCHDCRARFEAWSAFVVAARTAPDGLDERRKHRLLAAIKPSLHQPSWQQAAWTRLVGLFGIPAGWRVPAAVAVVVFAVMAWSRPSAKHGGLDPRPMAVGGPLPGESLASMPFEFDGLSAQINADAMVWPTDRGLELVVGTLAASYARPVGAAPLEISTPHARVIVRGTVFTVTADEHGTRVGVLEGLIEVIARDGASGWVPSGSQAIVDGRGGLEIERLGLDDAARLEPLAVGHAQPHATEPALPAPAPTSREPVPERSPNLAALAPPSDAAPAPGVADARVAWRQGRTVEALRLLADLLGRPSLSRELRVDALYLRASIERQLHSYAEAAATLAEVMSNANPDTARLARLERARILARQLGATETARLEFERVVADIGGGAVVDQGWVELCSLMVRERHADAIACISRALAAVPHGPSRQALLELQRVQPATPVPSHE